IQGDQGMGGNFFDLLRNENSRKTIKTIRAKLIIEYARSNSGVPSQTPLLSVQNDLYKIALFRMNEAYTGSKYHFVTGVKIGDWGTREPLRIEGDPVLSIPDSIEYFMRERDHAT